MVSTTEDLQRVTWRWALLGGIVSILLGILIMVWPGPTLLVVAFLLGFQLIAWGMMLILQRILNADGIGGVLLGIIGGVIIIILGLAVLRAPGLTIAWMAIFIGAGWVVAGMFETIEGFTSAEGGERVWAIILGILSVVAGVIVMSTPIASIAALTIWTGILMIVLGVARVIAAFQIRNA